MNYTKFSFFSPRFGLNLRRICFGFCLLFLLENRAVAQSNNTDGLSLEEINQINAQPIAKKVGGRQSNTAESTRNLTFEYKDEKGTQIREYREGVKPVEIQVDSSFGTHYEMSPPMIQSPNQSGSPIERVPSVRLPF